MVHEVFSTVYVHISGIWGRERDYQLPNQPTQLVEYPISLQNCRIIEVGRELWGHWVQPSFDHSFKLGGGREQTAVTAPHSSCRITDPSLPSLKPESLSSRGSECRHVTDLQDESWLLFLRTSSCPWLHPCALLSVSSKPFCSFGSFPVSCPRGS